MPGKMRARAFCPGHLTGLFVIKDDAEDLEEKGSLGTGLCLSRGAMSRVKLSMGMEEVTVHINGKEDEAPVTKKAVEYMMSGTGMDVEIQTSLELPVGQGLGMSGAGAFSSCLALCKILGLPKEEALKASHRAEVECGTGLGDIAAQNVGGLTVRKKPGIPPFGEVESFKTESQVFLCVMEGEKSTSDILQNEEQRGLINKAGKKWYDELGEEPDLETMMKCSFEFAKESTLITEVQEELCQELWDHGHMASLTMLGNSIFCIPGKSNPMPLLSKKGRLFELEIENKPARIFG